MEPTKNETQGPTRKRGRTKSGEIQKAPGFGVTKKDITAAKISEAMTKRTPDTLRKLEEAFSIDATVEEACMYANISEQTYYAWVKDEPQLAERFKTLRLKPVLKARKEVVDGIAGDKHFAMGYLRKKRRAEFGDIPYLPAESETRTGVVMLPQRRVTARETVVREIIVEEHAGGGE